MSAPEPVSLNYELDILPESTWIVATPDPTVKQAAPHVMEVGEFFARERYYTRRRNLPSFLIKYTLGGAGLLEYAGREEQIPARHAFWIDCIEPQYSGPTRAKNAGTSRGSTSTARAARSSTSGFSRKTAARTRSSCRSTRTCRR